MHTVDRVFIRAPLARVFALACDVERWPEILPHYRWVRVLEGRPDGEGRGTRVEMAAWRPFGPPPLRYPTWWVSEMQVEPADAVIRYRHVAGLTRGMEVRWTMREQDDGVAVEIVHEWGGPPWPLIGALAARVVIGPVFVHGIAARTLRGLRRLAEAG